MVSPGSPLGIDGDLHFSEQRLEERNQKVSSTHQLGLYGRMSLYMGYRQMSGVPPGQGKTTHMADTSDNFRNAEIEGRNTDAPMHTPADTQSASSQDAMSRMADILESINASIQQMVTSLTDKKIEESNDKPDSNDTFIRSESSKSSHKSSEYPMQLPVNEGSSIETPVVTDVRECNFRQLMEQNMDQPRHVIDILLAGSVNADEYKAWHSGQQFTVDKISRTNNADHAESEATLERKWIHQVHINSAFVLELLGDCMQKAYNVPADDLAEFVKPPRVFIRLFEILLDYHQAMRTRLQELSQPNKDANHKPECLLGESPSACPDPQTMGELRCCLDFVKGRLMPDLDRYRYPTQPVKENQTIPFRRYMVSFLSRAIDICSRR